MLAAQRLPYGDDAVETIEPGSDRAIRQPWVLRAKPISERLPEAECLPLATPNKNETTMLATQTHHPHGNSHTALLTGGGGFAALATLGTVFNAFGGKTPATWVEVIVVLTGMGLGYLFARHAHA
jgi:hypothetical protein